MDAFDKTTQVLAETVDHLGETSWHSRIWRDGQGLYGGSVAETGPAGVTFRSSHAGLESLAQLEELLVVDLRCRTGQSRLGSLHSAAGACERARLAA